MVDGVSFRLVQALAAPSGPAGSGGRTTNELSAVLQVEYGQHRFWFTGDMEAVGETLLLNQGQLQPISVLKVGHHGSRTSSGEEFLRALAPQYAIT